MGKKESRVEKTAREGAQRGLGEMARALYAAGFVGDAYDWSLDRPIASRAQAESLLSELCDLQSYVANQIAQMAVDGLPTAPAIEPAVTDEEPSETAT